MTNNGKREKTTDNVTWGNGCMYVCAVPVDTFTIRAVMYICSKSFACTVHWMNFIDIEFVREGKGNLCEMKRIANE